MYRSTQAMHMLTKPQVFYDETHKQALGYQNPFHLKKAQRIQPTLYDGSVIAKLPAVISVIDDEETLILEEESRSKMLDKKNDPISIENKIKISLIDYSKLNKIKEDFGKHFVTQKELSVEQAFWLKHSSLSKTPITSHTPVRIEAPSELPKVSLINESRKKLKYQLANFDKVVKKRLTSDAITAGSWGFEHTKECFVTEIIPFLKVLKDTFNAFDKTLLDEIIEVQNVFNQIEAAVDQCFVDKNVFEIQIKQLRIDNDKLLNQIMSQEIVHIVANSVDILDVKKSCVNNCNKCLELETELLKKKDFIEKGLMINLENYGENLNALTFNQLFEINELKVQSQEKDMVIRKLKDRIKCLSEKEGVENVKKDIDEIETINIELEHSVNNRDDHEVYIEKTIEYTNTLSGLVESAITQNPCEPLLESACMFTKHDQELLVYASQTCPSSLKHSGKLVAVTPMNKDKKVRFTEPVTSSSNIPKHTDSLKPKDSNKPLLTSTGVKLTTSASGSMPLGNTKNNRIT
ncbi:hypothetical protein Tco_1128788 [Tanacetum coccineum]